MDGETSQETDQKFGGLLLNKTASTVSHDSKASDDTAILDNPDYIQPSQMAIHLTDIDSEYLHGDLSRLLEVEYLSVVTAEQAQGGELEPARQDNKSLDGIILVRNTRFVMNIPCRRHSRRNSVVSPQKALPFHNVFFVVDTASPNCYLCKEAMEALMIDNSGEHENGQGAAIPREMRVQLITGHVIEFQLSGPDSHFSNVNIIGGSILQRTDLVSCHPKQSFSLTFG